MPANDSPLLLAPGTPATSEKETKWSSLRRLIWSRWPAAYPILDQRPVSETPSKVFGVILLSLPLT